MNTRLRESASAVHSQATSEETPYIAWLPQPRLPQEKERIMEQIRSLEKAIVMELEYSTDLACQKRVERYANRLALLLQTCG